ncbi:MAG: hypothetical protein GYA42_00990 [Syntrophomonadaceae bacterium]|nr:hypothetical protein [Syntrophomonadaceae bacterium]
MESGQMADLLRRVRHDFANHLQVVSGYLDIGKPQQARDYLRQVIGEMNAARMVFDHPSSEAALYFYRQMLQASELGFKLHFQNLAADDWKILELHNEPLHTLKKFNQSQMMHRENDDVRLSFGCDEKGVTMCFIFPGREGEVHLIRVDRE